MTCDLVLSESPQAAKAAAKLVKVTYKDVKPPILTIKDAIKADSFHAMINVNHNVGDATGKIIYECFVPSQTFLYYIYEGKSVKMVH